MKFVFVSLQRLKKIEYRQEIYPFYHKQLKHLALESIKIHDKSFVPFIMKDEIENRIREIAAVLESKFADKQPVFLIVLNGASFFAIDLLKKYKHPCSIQFLRLKSYQGTNTTGKVKTIGTMPGGLNGRDIVIIEDIVDTGLTMTYLKNRLEEEGVRSITIVTLLDKPSRRVREVEVEVAGFTIPDVFVVGYGLDYDDLGRNTEHIYKISDSN